MKDKIIDILKYVWNPKFDLNNKYEYHHLHDMANFILDVLDDDQREIRINEFLKKNSTERYQGDISSDKSDSVTSLILGWANPQKNSGDIITQDTSTFSLYSDQELPTNFSYPQLFINISQNSKDIDVGNWDFIDAKTESGALAYEFRKREGFNLIPFARLLDWAAYFDGDDINGDPSVFVFDLGDMPHHVKFENFKYWLDEAPSF